MPDPSKGVASFLEAYGRAWESRNSQEIARFYGFPAMVITPVDIAHLADINDGVTYFEKIVRANWDALAHPWSLTDLAVISAGEHATLASLTWAGKDSEGIPLGSHRHTYVMTRHEQSWRILADVLH